MSQQNNPGQTPAGQTPAGQTPEQEEQPNPPGATRRQNTQQLPPMNDFQIFQFPMIYAPPYWMEGARQERDLNLMMNIPGEATQMDLNSLLDNLPPQMGLNFFMETFLRQTSQAPQGMVNIGDAHNQQPSFFSLPMNQGRQRIRPHQNRQSSFQPPSHINKVYYKKAPTKRTFPTAYDETEPYIRISSVKQNDTNPEESYTIVRDGLVNSKKNTDIEDIMVGRQQNIQLNDDQIYPNDIVLPINDRAISRVHCKIQISKGFQSDQDIKDEQLKFDEICRVNKLYLGRLPKTVLNLIREFSYTPPQFFIQDLGSVQGTYLKVRNNRDNIVERGNIYFIGAETLFHVKEIKDFCTDEDFHCPEEAIYDLLSHLKQAEQEDIHGLSQQEVKNVEARLKDGKIPPKPSIGLNRPYLKIDFQPNSPGAKHLFVARQDPSNPREFIETQFKFGRNQDNDVVINQNTISRKQCRIKYCPQQKRWFISDGEVARESSNGTWMSVCDWYQKQEKPREESKPRVLENNSEIKISESVLKFEMVNFHKMARKKQQKQEEKRLKFLQSLLQRDE